MLSRPRMLTHRHPAEQGCESMPPTAARAGGLYRSLLDGLLVGLILVVGIHLYYLKAGRNFRPVLPGLAYRCAQPRGADLERLVAVHGIRAIYNFRGTCPDAAWYQEEQATARRLGVPVVDLGFRSDRPPSPAQLRRLVAALDAAPCPVLLHCYSGADRTGLAAGMFLLLHTDADLNQARAQLHPRYGHSPFGSARWMDRFLRSYASWLRFQHLEHTPDHFRRWAQAEYRPQDCQRGWTPAEDDEPEE